MKKLKKSTWIIILGICAACLFIGYKVNLGMKIIDCSIRLNGIAKYIETYQFTHKGSNPPSLKTLLEMDIGPNMLVCGSSDDDPDQGDVSFAYRGADLNDKAPVEMILVYDKQGNHKNKTRKISKTFCSKQYLAYCIKASRA